MNTLSQTPYMKIMRRMGAATFLFFLVKGLLWLAAPLVFYYAM